MRASIGNSLLLSIVIVIVTTIIIIFVSTLAYSKAYRVKNRIIEIIENNYNHNASLNSFNYDEVKQEINDYLHQTGYRVGKLDSKECKKRLQDRNVDVSDDNNIIYNGLEYKYCIGKKNVSKYENIYVVVTYVEFNLPIVGNIVPISVSGETKTLGR